MHIREMTQVECRRCIPRVALCRLACAQAGQPYVVPVYLALHEGYFYGFSLAGRKIECMRANPSVCVEIEELKRVTEWTTVVVFGTYEELPNTPEHKTKQIFAYEQLQAQAMWWEPAAVRVTNTDPSKPFIPIFYRIRIDQLTGHVATADPTSSVPAPDDRHGFLIQLWRKFRSRN